jgi:transcriptional regulator GlxA family with amidase domain
MNAVQVGSAEELEQVVNENFAPVKFAGSRPGFRRGQLALQDLGGGVSLMAARSASVGASSGMRFLAKGTPEDSLLFCVHASGIGGVRQHRRVAELPAGAGTLYEGRSPFELDFETGMSTLTLIFPRELLPARSAVISGHCARAMPADAPAMRLAFSYMKQLNKSAGWVSPEQRHDAGHAAINLLTMALRDLGDSSGEKLPSVLLERMRQHVREQFADQRLTVAELARRHHVSVRQAHAVFAEAGDTPGAFLREQRLRAARAALADPRYRDRPVSGVAAAAGFAELRTFERAFHREYGMAPGQWRGRHLRPPLDPFPAG